MKERGDEFSLTTTTNLTNKTTTRKKHNKITITSTKQTFMNEFIQTRNFEGFGIIHTETQSERERKIEREAKKEKNKIHFQSEY